jgi:sporulation protein YlmC with PRC-barrel domain
MKARRGADVFTQDEQKVGKLTRVVINPANYQITHIILDKGPLFAADKMVPIGLVGPVAEHIIFLRLHADEVERLNDFPETHFHPVEIIDWGKRPDEGEYPQALFWYPPHGTMWWVRGTYPNFVIPPFVTTTGTILPHKTILLEQGWRVISIDGIYLGNIDELLTDLRESRATHLVISAGVFLKIPKMIPTLWIETVKADEVRLSITSDFLIEVPAYVLPV